MKAVSDSEPISPKNRRSAAKGLQYGVACLVSVLSLWFGFAPQATVWGSAATQDAASVAPRRALAAQPAGAIILVAGRNRLNDFLQNNIHNVTNAAYRLFSSNGYPKDRIYYLATDLTLDADGDDLPDVDAMPSQASLANAITQWAVDKVGADRPLTIYVINSGTADRIALDLTINESATANELDGWLDQLESAVGAVEINLVIEQCYAGSLITGAQTVSQQGRVVIASTGETGLAYASADGAVFSDALLGALVNTNLFSAFQQARWAALAANPGQGAVFDDNGDAVMDVSDGAIAAQRLLLPAVADDATPVPTSAPTSTPTLAPTPTNTSGPSPTPTATRTPSSTSSADAFENDDICARAVEIDVDGTGQQHTFHRAGDIDWVQFFVAAGERYRIEVQPMLASLADVDLERYNDCVGLPVDEWHETFTPSVRFDFTPSISGPIYLRLANHDAGIFGESSGYTVLVRRLNPAPVNRAVVIAAGRLRGADPLQTNINNLAEAAYALFSHKGYTGDDIYVVATNTDLTGYDAAATNQNLRAAITTWAKDHLGPDGVFTLYMVDHGVPGKFYLDELNDQVVTPGELDAWLTELETSVPGLKVNVIIEACESGSFVGVQTGVSKAGRVVITSSDAEHDAMVSLTGAYFSDHLLSQLYQGYNLAASFAAASEIAQNAYSLQVPLLDADGDGTANEFEDAGLAAGRSFAYPGTLAGEPWSPSIFSVQLSNGVSNYSGVVRADVRDDVRVRLVWGVVYPPGYTPPDTTQELQPEVLANFLLTPTGEENIYAGRYDGFTQNGVYRINIYAVDNEGLVSPPRTLEVLVGSAPMYLPAVMGGS